MTTPRGTRQKESKNVGPIPEYVNVVAYFECGHSPIPNILQKTMLLLGKLMPLGPAGFLVEAPSLYETMQQSHRTGKITILDENIYACFSEFPEDSAMLYFSANRYGGAGADTDYLWFAGIDSPLSDSSVRIKKTTLYISIRESYIRSRNPTLVVDSLFDLIATENALYGFAEVSTPDTFGGCQGYTIDNMGLRFSLEFALREKVWWSSRTNYQQQVRGVYWGNYLNPKVVAALREGASDAIAEFARYPDGAPPECPNGIPRVKIYESGAAYLSLGDDIMQMSVINGYGTGKYAAEIWLAELLYCHLRARNLIV